MIPESRLIQTELTIRELSLPDDILLAKKSLLRWVALSLGMIAPNESRILLLDIMDVIFGFHIRGESPATKDIIAKLEQKTGEKANPKALYYHLQKLINAGILSRKKGRYALGSGEERSLKNVFRSIYISRTSKAFENIGKALDKLEGNYERV